MMTVEERRARIAALCRGEVFGRRLSRTSAEEVGKKKIEALRRAANSLKESEAESEAARLDEVVESIRRLSSEIEDKPVSDEVALRRVVERLFVKRAGEQAYLLWPQWAGDAKIFYQNGLEAPSRSSIVWRGEAHYVRVLGPIYEKIKVQVGGFSTILFVENIRKG